MRYLWWSVGLLLLIGGCGGGDGAATTTTSPATFPTGVVRDWLDAVGSGDLRAIATAVDETSATVVIAAENGYTVGELAALLDGGLPEGVASSYWTSFESAFEEFRGIKMSSLVVGDFSPIEVDAGEFAAVELESPEGLAEVVTRRAADGRWRVDMVATFGPALVRTLRSTLDDAAADPDGAVVRAGYARSVLPALEAAVALDTGDTLLQSQLAAMRLLVGDQ